MSFENVIIRGKNIFHSWNMEYQLASNDYFSSSVSMILSWLLLLQVVLASATNLYLDHPQEPDPAERGLVWATRFVSAKRSFSYSPMNLYSSTDVDIRGRPYTECFDNRFQCTDLKKPENVEGKFVVF